MKSLLTGGPAALLSLALCASTALAQGRTEVLPPLHVTDSRLGAGITGASTTVITAAQIERSPAQSLTEILAREPGVQVRSLFGGNGARDSVDLRGFGAAGVSNTLVLVNGRRLNDIDMAAVDLAAIPLNSIDRVEITRGNSGAVLYGDGAVGGVINIVTKNGAAMPPSLKLEGAGGSYGTAEARVSANAASGPLAAAAFGNSSWSDGYRFNNGQRQNNGVADLRYTFDRGSVYFNVTGDDQHVGLPGGRRVTTGSSLFVTAPRGAATPLDYADKQGFSATTGIAYMLSPGTELIVDGGVRRKAQQGGFFSSFSPAFDSYVDTMLTTFSITPRLNSQHDLFGVRGKATVGIDYYDASYESGRALHRGDAFNHRYDLGQRTLAIYGQETLYVRPDTDLSFGARVQRNTLNARDRLDTTAPGGFFAAPQGMPLDTSETQHAWHVGVEHRLTESFAVFARTARSFRLPNVDERVATSPFGTATNFALRTQTSQDYEAGIRLQGRGVTWQTSAYLMDLVNELHFSPATFTNTNLDPTRRYGMESMLTVQAGERVRLTAGVAYTRAVFREGPFAGKDVPLVSPFTGSAGIAWDIIPRALVFDAIARYSGERRFDNDQRNIQPVIPASTVVDLRLGGEVPPQPGMPLLNWSLAVLNAFDTSYYNYGIASAFTVGTYDVYPQPRRAFMARLGATF
jgi:iron complex outermembrane receptor protein